MKKIFIIHGWTYSMEGWDACASLLKEKGFEPVVLKVPGLTEPSQKVYTLSDYVLWLEEETRGERNIILVGHSNGGRIAIAYAAKYPATLSKLVLMDAAGIVHNEPALELKRKIFGTLASLGKFVSKSPALRKVFYKVVGESDYEKAPPNMRETMKNLISVDLKDELSKITASTLVIWGENDSVTPLSDGELMHEKIKNSKLEIISGARHSPHMTHPNEVVETLEKFFK